MKKRNDGIGESNVLQNQFTKYVITAIHRKKIDYLRSLQKQQIMESLEENISSLNYNPNLDLGLPILEQLENAALFYALKQINHRSLQIVFMKTIADLSFLQISQILGMKYQATANAYYRAIKQIKRYLEGR